MYLGQNGFQVIAPGLDAPTAPLPTELTAGEMQMQPGITPQTWLLIGAAVVIFLTLFRPGRA